MQNTFQDVKTSVVMWCLDGFSIQETGASTGQFSSHWKPNGMVQCGPFCSMSYSPTEGIDALGELKHMLDLSRENTFRDRKRESERSSIYFTVIVVNLPTIQKHEHFLATHWHKVASFPGPAQLSVTCSTEKR